jgi:hypothetical protein
MSQKPMANCDNLTVIKDPLPSWSHRTAAASLKWRGWQCLFFSWCRARGLVKSGRSHLKRLRILRRSFPCPRRAREVAKSLSGTKSRTQQAW